MFFSPGKPPASRLSAVWLWKTCGFLPQFSEPGKIERCWRATGSPLQAYEGEAIMKDSVKIDGYEITSIGESLWYESNAIPWASVQKTFLWLAAKFAKISPGPWVDMWCVGGWKPMSVVRTPDGLREYVYMYPSAEYRFRCWPMETPDCWETDSGDVYEHAVIRTVFPYVPLMSSEPISVVINKALDQLKQTGWFWFRSQDVVDPEGMQWFWVKVEEDGRRLFMCDSHLFFRIVKNYTPTFRELAGLAYAGLIGVEFSRGWGGWLGVLCKINALMGGMVHHTVYDAALASEKLCLQIAASPTLWTHLARGGGFEGIDQPFGFLSGENLSENSSQSADSGNEKPTGLKTVCIQTPVVLPFRLKSWKEVDKYLADKIQWPNNWTQRQRITFIKAILKHEIPGVLPQKPGQWPKIWSEEIDALIHRLSDLIKQCEPADHKVSKRKEATRSDSATTI
jgi:hypothetical protein